MVLRRNSSRRFFEGEPPWVETREMKANGERREQQRVSRAALQPHLLWMGPGWTDNRPIGMVAGGDLSGDPRPDLPLTGGLQQRWDPPASASSSESPRGWHVLPQQEGLRLSGAGGGCRQPDPLLSQPCGEFWWWGWRGCSWHCPNASYCTERRAVAVGTHGDTAPKPKDPERRYNEGAA